MFIGFLRENEDKIKKILPETWTHVHNLNGLKLGYQLKLLGLNWWTNEGFAEIMVQLEKSGLMLRDNFLVKANPHRVFEPIGP